MNTSEQISKFINSDSSFLVIEGAAGTGKTHLIGIVVEYLNQLNFEYYLLAPTGRAARNLATRLAARANNQPSTIHAFLYEAVDSKEDYLEVSQFALKKPSIASNAIIIIDEASMLSNQDNTDPLLKFGTGFLLNDLLEFIDIKNNHRKIIFVGDCYQLPPINERESISLNIEELKKFCSNEVQKITLDKIYRQKSESSILKISFALKDQIQSHNFLQIPIESQLNEVFDVELDQAIDDYMWSYQKNSIFITYTNDQVDQINQKFREKSHFSPVHLEKNERLILMRNCWMGENKLYNGDFLYVTAVGKEEHSIITIKENQEKTEVHLKFLTVTLYDKNNKFHFNCKILSHKLWSENINSSKNERNALIIDFRKRNPHLKPQSAEYAHKIKIDPYFNALHVKFGYAITCHKAQGGEWDEAYIRLDRPQNDLKTRSGFQWMYTAITRARKKIFFIHRPLTKEFNSASPFEFLVCKMQTDLKNSGFELINHREHQFELQLSVEKNGITSRFKLYRNAKMTVTRLMKINETERSPEIVDILQKYVNTSLVEEISK